MALRDTVERLRDGHDRRANAAQSIAFWRAEVSKLYDAIEGWLKPYLDDGGILLERQPTSVTEDGLDPYEIDRLDIEVGTETVRLDPRGTIVIGARGRIDMSHLGSGDPIYLVLVGSDDRPGWSIVEPKDRKNLRPLTKETFESALESLLESYGVREEPPM